MLLEAVKNTGLAVIQTLMLAGIGYILVRRNFIDNAGLSTLSRLVVEITLPLLIFCQLAKEFSFSIYPNWWMFPLMSMFVSVVALAVGCVFIKYIKGTEFKKQFLSLIAFQNAGYLPIALVTALLPKDKLDSMLIYLFLFLMGFNLVIWSFGVYILTFTRAKKFELGSLFSPPVVATLFSLVFVFFGLPKIVPAFIFKPLRMIGDCTVPLAMLVVGGNLAQIRLTKIDKKAVFFILISKMIILPAAGLWLVFKLGLPELIGLLIVMQLAVPPATSLSVIIRHYKKEDMLISQGILWGHIVGIVTIPLFLSLYFLRFMVK